MAVTAKFYGQVFAAAFNKEIDFDSDTIKVMLVTSAYAFDQDAHKYKSSVTNEVTGTGYTAGGVTLTSPTITYNAASNLVVLDAADVSWLNSTITARGAVIYDGTPATDATRPLIAFVDFGQDITSSGGTFSITWDATGIASVSVA